MNKNNEKRKEGNKRIFFKQKQVYRTEEEKRIAMFQKLKKDKVAYKCKKDENYRDALKKTRNFYEGMLQKKDGVIQKLRENVKHLKDFIEEDTHYYTKLHKKQKALHAETDRLKKQERRYSFELQQVKVELNKKKLVQQKHDELHNIIQQKERKMLSFEECFLGIGDDFFKEIDDLEAAVTRFQKNNFLGSDSSQDDADN